MKKVLFLFLIVILLTSCSSVRAYYLEGEEESIAYLVHKNTLVSIKIPFWVTLSYCDYSNTSGKAYFESLFGLKATSYGKANLQSYNKRLEYLELLKKESNKSDGLSAYAFYHKDLRKTDFIDTMNSLSSSFDDEKLLKEIKDNTHVYEYELENILSKTAPWDRQKAYLELWIKAILRNIWEKK